MLQMPKQKKMPKTPTNWSYETLVSHAFKNFCKAEHTPMGDAGSAALLYYMELSDADRKKAKNRLNSWLDGNMGKAKRYVKISELEEDQYNEIRAAWSAARKASILDLQNQERA